MENLRTIKSPRHKTSKIIYKNLQKIPGKQKSCRNHKYKMFLKTNEKILTV